MNLISSEIAKHVDVLKLFTSIALSTVGLQQLLHYEVTTHCCATLAQTLAMWWASDQCCQLVYIYTKFQKFGIFSRGLVYNFLIWYIFGIFFSEGYQRF